MAASVTGGSYIELPANAAFDSRYNSISFWFKTTSAITNSSPVSRNLSTQSYSGWYTVLGTSGQGLAIGAKNNFGTSVVSAGTSGVVNNGAWHHSVCYWGYTAGDAMGIYVDGAMIQIANSTGPFSPGGNATRIGRNVDSFWGNYNGEVAEFGYWNDVLTADEIVALSKGFSPRLVRPANLICHYPLVRSVLDRRGLVAPSANGSTVTDHPRIIGGLV